MNFPTWSDLNNESIVPPLGARKAPDIGHVAVMAASKPDINQIKSLIDTPKVFPFFNNTLVTSQDSTKGVSVAGPFMGAPYAAMLLESLIVRGACKILMLGWCGAIKKSLNVGDLILVENAIVDEGTSHHYQAVDQNKPCSKPSSDLTEKLSEYLAYEGINAFKETIWTTDAIYRETPDKVAWYAEQGAAVVEMECSALFSVARFRKVEVAALLVVSDSLASEEWKHGFRKKAFKEARLKACNTIMNFAEQLIENE